MPDPTPLSNILFYGFFTSDLTVSNSSSITTIPQHFVSLTKNLNNNLGIITNPYIQNVSYNNNVIESTFNQVNDSANFPINLSLTYNLSNVQNNNGIKNYANSVLMNISKFIYLNSSGEYVEYPETSFLVNIKTPYYNFEDYILNFRNINFQYPTPNFYSSLSLNTQFEDTVGNIQIDFGYGNILPNWVNNDYIIYNPFLANIYNNSTFTGDQKSNCWIIYSSDY
jgi:hypothetical protein